MWSVIQRLIVNNGCHSFMACRPERPKEGYTIDFSTRDSVDYVPMMRRGCGLSGSEVIRSDFHLGLDAAHLEFVRHVDGRRTVRDIAERMARSPGSWQNTAGNVQEYGREVCEWLWRLDVIAIALAPTTVSPTSTPAKVR